MPARDVTQEVAAQAAQQHRPEVVSVLVALPLGQDGPTPADRSVVEAAGRMLAATDYPSLELGPVLHVEWDGLAAGQHEVLVLVR
jgi:hypothetical protein